MRVSLKEYTTFRLGGPCPDLVTVADAESAAEVIRGWNAAGVPWRVMGGGSNLLVADAGIPEAVLQISAEVGDIHGVEGGVCVSAGTALDELSRVAAEAGWSGLGFAAGIPGTVGGGVCGNAGAFGVQLGDVLERVEVLTAAGEKALYSHAALEFGYRCSALQRMGCVATRIWFRTERGDPVQLIEERENILAMRREKHPDWRLHSTAGSFFKNLPPEKPGAQRRAVGQYLESAGAKAMREGGAYVFEKHANIVIAGAGATARNVAGLTTRMAAAVRNVFGYVLEPEVRFWGAV